ncbi:DUF1223 domain-containing protein [Paraherbaspirillum soli]|uniref:DUF1223 domain-containing protein n=1 Tax=Paraherbaspirillum soli TaxID=631222 RepID=A0ABW0MEI9_9BURK
MHILSTISKYGTLATFAAGLVPLAEAADYSAHSPANRVALVELYSSEGCSSCPPADAWLSKMGAQAKADMIVPLALHVDYWDQLGWKDRFASHQFTVRQQALSDAGKGHVIYTPEIFVGGRELRHWNSAGAFDSAIKNIVAQPSPADILIKLSSSAPRLFDLSASIKLRQDSKQEHEAYVAVYENKLVSKVAAGENGGVTLHHDYVVRRWLGPFALQGGAAQIHEKIALDSIGQDVRADRFGIVALVQNTASGEVLQATALAMDH